MPAEKSALDRALEAEEALFPLPTPEEHDTGVPAASAAPPAAAEPPPVAATPPAPPVVAHTSEPASPPAPAAVTEPPPSLPAAPPSPAAAPVAETPPAATPPAAETEGAPWKAKREAERREREALAELNAAREREQQLMREIEAARRGPAQAPPPPATETPLDDPLLAVEDRVNRLERDLAEQRARNAQLDQSVQRQTRDTTLAREADQFTREHPDFPAARDYYIQRQIEEAELTGELDAVAADLRQRVPDQIRNAARERGVTEASLSRELAQAVLFENRLSMMERTAAARGKSVVETVYELAQKRGFSHTGTPTPPPAPNGGSAPMASQNVALSAAEQLRQEQSRAAASSLATMPSSPAAPVGSGSLTYAGFLGMNSAEQGRLIERLDTAARYGLVPENWSEELQAGRTVPVPDSEQLKARMGDVQTGLFG